MKLQKRDRALRSRQAFEDAVAWRRRSLLGAGFPDDLAAEVAAEVRLDLHALLQLVDRGCPPELAVRIVDPSPGEVGS